MLGAWVASIGFACMHMLDAWAANQFFHGIRSPMIVFHKENQTAQVGIIAPKITPIQIVGFRLAFPLGFVPLLDWGVPFLLQALHPICIICWWYKFCLTYKKDIKKSHQFRTFKFTDT